MQRIFAVYTTLLSILVFFISFESYSQTCAGFDGGPVAGGLTQISNGELCANKGFGPGQMRIDAFNVTDGGIPNSVGFQIDWNDGSALEVITVAAGQITHPSANAYVATVNHLFPATGANVRCEYFPSVRLMVTNGATTTVCTATLGTSPRFLRYNREGELSGALRLTETATSVREYLVCRGTTTTITFTDRSTLNCVPPQLTENPTNTLRRWRRFVYGTVNTITSATGVQVDGVVQGYPFLGGLVTSALSGVANPLNPRPTLPITIPADAEVGQIFEITMQYWNPCNKQPDGAPPATQTAWIRIVDQPVNPGVTNNIVCSGTNPLPAFQITAAGTPTVTWYRDNANSPGTVISSGTSKSLPAASFPGGITNTTPGVYRVWASYNATNNPDGVACESQKVPLTLTIVESLAQPAVISGTTDICNGSSVTFTLPAAAGSTTNGGAVNYEWDIAPASGWTLTGTTATSATFTINVIGIGATAARTLRVRRRYATSHSGTGCPSGDRTLPLTIFGPSQGGTATGGGNFCQGADVGAITLASERGTIQRWEVSTNGSSFSNTGLPATNTVNPGILSNGNYLYRAVVANGTCAEANSNDVAITISVNPTPATTGADQALCSAGLTSAGLGGSDPAPGTGLWTVFSKPVGSNIVFNSGTNARNTTVTADRVGVYVLRWRVTNGTCDSSDDIIVDFGTDPGVQSAGAATPVCGTSFTLSGSTPTIGTGTWTLVTPPAGGTVSFDNVNLPGATVTLTPAGTEKFGAYTFRWSVVSGTCTPRTANVVITFSRPATAAVPANFNTCVDGTTLAPIAITGTVGAGAGAAQQGRWEIVTGTGSFTSNNANPGLAKVGPNIADNYKPSAGDFAAGSAQIRLVAMDPDVGGPCGNVNSTTLVITFDRVPTNVNAGPDQLLVCAPTATLAALAPTNGTGIWSDPLSAGVSFTNINDRNTAISNLPVGATTLRWTVASALGVCASVPDEVKLVRNPLPAVNNLLPEVCEITSGGGAANNIVLTTNDNLVTGGAANTSVAWFTDAGPAGPILPATTPQSLSNAAPSSLDFFTRVTNSLTTCTNTGTVTYTVNPLPAAIDFSKSYCEDFPVGSNKVDNINLTAADLIAGVTGGAANRLVSWFLDAAATAQPIPTPTDFDIAGSKVIFARVRNTNTNCEDVSQVDLIIKARPVNQPLQGKEAVCKDGVELYKVNPIAGATYTWTIDPQFSAFLGGGPTETVFLVEFPNIVTGNVGVTLTVNGCAGNPLSKTVAVSSAPDPLVINGTNQACENEIGVPYNVVPNNDATSSYNWEIIPAGGALVATGQTKGSVLINFLTSDVTIRVTETNSSNCASLNSPTKFVTIHQRPTLADISNEVCSEDDAAIILVESGTSAVPAVQYNITSVAVDPGLISLSGPTSGIVNSNAIALDRFENPTGGSLRVRYTVEPISADGCAGTAKTVQLTVKPEPLLDITSSGPVCSSTPLNRALTVVGGSVPADLFIIDSVIPDAGLTPGAGNPLALGQFDKNVLIDDVWENQTGAQLTVTYNIRPFSSASNCAGTPALPLKFTIYPEPRVVSASKGICSGDIVNLTLATSNVANTTFTWTVKSASAGITGAAPGTGASILDILTNTSGGPGTVVYSVRATNPALLQNCQGPAEDVTITVNPAPSVTNITKTICSDNAGGNTVVEDLTSLENTIHSGGGVTFEWFDELGAPIVGPALTGYSMRNNISVTAKVTSTCPSVATVTYIINPLPQLVTTVSNFNGFEVSCNTSTNGQINATAPQGTAPFLFSINGGANFFPTGSFNSLGAGAYVIRVKDNKGCIVDSPPVMITAPTALTIGGTITDVTCKGTSTGKILITAGGGITTKPYTYSLNGSSPGQLSNLFENVPAGTHTIMVTDDNGCSKSTTVVVGEPSLLTVSITAQTNVSCNGVTDGSVTVAGSGGVSINPYQYSIDGGFNFQASGTFGPLPAGSYNVIVRDNNNCSAQVPVTITQPAVLGLNLISKTDVDCNGSATGSLTVAGAGGTSPYQYSIDGGTNFQPSGTFSVLTQSPGYSILVKDAKNCTTTLVVPINEPVVLGGTITSQTNVICNGGSTGTVTVNGSGGTGTYRFSIDGGPFGVSGTFPGLAAGSYTVTVKDQNACTIVVPLTISQPPVLSGSVQSKGDISCNGGNDGTVTIQAAGGVLPYAYSINGGVTFVNTTGIFNGLAANNYTVTIKDAHGCTFDVPFVITEPTVLNGSITDQTPVDCKGNATGSVIVDGSGGTAPYEYSIDGSTFLPSGVFGTLTAGSYVVRIRDSKQCLKNVNVSITEPTQLVLSVQTQVNVDCNGNSSGSVTLIATGGVGGYTYSNDNATYVASPTFAGLNAISHTFFVLDGNACPAQTSTIITEPSDLELNLLSKADVLCHGESTGTISIQAAGGAGSYEYSKDGLNFGPLNVFSGLSAAGSPYTITVRDANSCTEQLVVPITEPVALGGTVSETIPVSCFIGNNAQLTVIATGGTAPYDYMLLQDPSNLGNGGVFDGIRAGTYRIRITDQFNCSFITAPITVAQPLQLKITGAVTSNFNGFQLSCENSSDGIIEAAVTGGTGPTFTYFISPDPNGVVSNTDGRFTNLPAGFYSITATDFNGCPTTIPASKLISAPLPFSPGYIGFDQFVCAGSDPAVINSIVSPFGGTLDFVYQWHESTDGISFSPVVGANSITYDPPVLAQTTYFKRIVSLASGGTLADGCGAIESNVVTITINPLPTVAISATPNAVCEGDIVFINLNFTGQAPLRYDYTASNIFGTNTFTDKIGGTITPIPVFNYTDETTYTVTRVKDFNNCEIFPIGVTVTPSVLKLDPVFAIDPPGAQCSGKVFNFSYENPPDPNVTYTFSWSDGTEDILTPGDGHASHQYNFPVVGGSTLIPVVLTASRVGCNPRSFTQTVELYPSVLVAIPPVDNVICSGETINFDNATDGATIHKWYYRIKGTTAEDHVKMEFKPSYTFENTTTTDPLIYEVVYEGANVQGCTGRATMDITVYRSLIADFDPDPIPQFIGGIAQLDIKNMSHTIGATIPVLEGAVFSYAWDFGVSAMPTDAADDASASIRVVYNTPGAKKVTLTVVNRAEPTCKSTYSETFVILVPPLTANFTATPLASCVPTTIVVNNVAGAADKFLWILEDENGAEIAASNLVNPSFDIQEAGTYAITLTATLTSTSQTISKTISGFEVFPRPQAIFTARPKQFFVPDTPIDLLNDSQGANTYEWDFGDGEHSIEIEPNHLYALEGTYDILLTVSNDHGPKDIDGDGVLDNNIVCYDTATQTVVAREGGATKIPNAFTPNVNGPGGGVDNGSGLNDTFLPITSGVQEFLMQIFDRWGNLIFESQDKTFGWDGYDKNGRLMPAGVYVYKLTLRLADDQRETRIGDVTMIR